MMTLPFLAMPMTRKSGCSERNSMRFLFTASGIFDASNSISDILSKVNMPFERVYLSIRYL